MAEERTLGLARAHDQTSDEPSKQELQRRLDEARDSISHTVGEIRETVASQVQAVKETLDWREQFKKRPVIWTAGAAGVGFLVGCGLAGLVKGDSSEGSSAKQSHETYDRYGEEPRSYAAQPILHAGAQAEFKPGNGKHDDGPGFFEKLTSSNAYHKVKDEAGNIGEAFVQEISKTAKQVVLPALITSLRNFIGGYLPNAKSETDQASGGTSMRPESRPSTPSTYQPALERNQS